MFTESNPQNGSARLPSVSAGPDSKREEEALLRLDEDGGANSAVVFPDQID
jgi:hypothetical protein